MKIFIINKIVAKSNDTTDITGAVFYYKATTTVQYGKTENAPDISIYEYL